jgi:hypothetical protein
MVLVIMGSSPPFSVYALPLIELVKVLSGLNSYLKVDARILTLVGGLPPQKYPSPRPVLSFEAWLEHWVQADSRWDCPPVDDHFETRSTYAEYAAWVMEDPQTWLLSRFSLNLVAKCLGNIPRPSGNARLPLELRKRILQAQTNVFEQVFEPNVGDYLSIQSELNPLAPELNACCFMWWDNCAFEETWSGQTFRFISQRCLASPSSALQESALHGLGHQICIVEDDIEAVRLIDQYLTSGNCVRPELAKYAEQARIGNVL